MTQPTSPDTADRAKAYPLTLRCHCGHVKIALTAAPIAQVYCHCSDCRNAHAAAYVASALYPTDSVQVLEGTLHPRVLKNRPRMACSVCGTHLFSELPELDARSVNAFLLPPGVFQPQMHLHCQEAILPVEDDLPHHRDWPPSHGGSEDGVGW
ncbi:MAG: GFA family protein [Lautropia sp.]|nr:GFA family protein [Lautropia sp.]